MHRKSAAQVPFRVKIRRSAVPRYSTEGIGRVVRSSREVKVSCSLFVVLSLATPTKMKGGSTWLADDCAPGGTAPSIGIEDVTLARSAFVRSPRNLNFHPRPSLLQFITRRRGRWGNLGFDISRAGTEPQNIPSETLALNTAVFRTTPFPGL